MVLGGGEEGGGGRRREGGGWEGEREKEGRRRGGRVKEGGGGEEEGEAGTLGGRELPVQGPRQVTSDWREICLGGASLNRILWVS